MRYYFLWYSTESPVLPPIANRCCASQTIQTHVSFLCDPIRRPTVPLALPQDNRNDALKFFVQHRRSFCQCFAVRLHGHLIHLHRKCPMTVHLDNLGGEWLPNKCVCHSMTLSFQVWHGLSNLLVPTCLNVLVRISICLRLSSSVSVFARFIYVAVVFRCVSA